MTITPKLAQIAINYCKADLNPIEIQEAIKDPQWAIYDYIDNHKWLMSRELGYTPEKCEEALLEADGDLHVACEELLDYYGPPPAWRMI